MNFFKKVFSKKQEKSITQAFLVFSHTSEVIQAEKVLKQMGFKVEVKGPPPQLRTGCDMVILFDLVLEPAIIKELEENNIHTLQTVVLNKELLDPVSLYHKKDYGDWLMVRVANMKITFEKSTYRIVNISGGGCPDVPYLASILLNKNIFHAEAPNIQGKTLCSYSLQKAFEYAREEAKNIQKESI